MRAFCFVFFHFAAAGHEHTTHLTDEEDSAFPGFHDREFHMLHRNIPALRRTGVDTAGIRQVSLRIRL